ncbi:MAG: Ig-like domain-containing protein [Acidobacteriota bacterium]
MLASRFRPSRAAVAAALALLLFSGCVSVRTAGVVEHEGDLGGVEVRVFPDDRARRAGAIGPRYVETVLEREHRGAWQPVFRALSPAWSVVELPPGRYRLRLPSLLDETGAEVPLDAEGKIFRVRPGEVQQVEATVSHVPRAWIAAGVLTAVVAAIVLDEWLEDHDLPRPPPLPDVVLDAVFHLTVDLAVYSWVGEGRRGAGGPVDLAPVVTSTFPQDGTTVAASWVRLVFALSEPLAVVDSAAVRVAALCGDESYGLEGQTIYDPERWWVTWEPDEDLPAGCEIDVTLDASGIADPGGNGLFGEGAFSFRTAP